MSAVRQWSPGSWPPLGPSVGASTCTSNRWVWSALSEWNADEVGTIDRVLVVGVEKSGNVSTRDVL